MNHEKRNWSRTYLVLNKNLEDFLLQDKMIIEGYFTLKIKPIQIKEEFFEEISNTYLKKMTNGITKPKDNLFPCVLIGQLRKYISKEYKSSLTGKEMLQLVFYLVKMIDAIAPMNCVILDTRKNEKVNQFYIDNGFKKFDSTEEFDAFIRVVSPDD